MCTTTFAIGSYKIVLHHHGGNNHLKNSERELLSLSFPNKQYINSNIKLVCENIIH